MTCGGSDALHERMKRRFSAPAGRGESFFTRARSSWWIVGTAEYHVAPCSFAVCQNESGLNFVGTTTVPPVESVARVDATRPWTWKSGNTQSDTSLDESA